MTSCWRLNSCNILICKVATTACNQHKLHYHVQILTHEGPPHGRLTCRAIIGGARGKSSLGCCLASTICWTARRASSIASVSFSATAWSRHRLG